MGGCFVVHARRGDVLDVLTVEWYASTRAWWQSQCLALLGAPPYEIVRIPQYMFRRAGRHFELVAEGTGCTGCLHGGDVACPNPQLGEPRLVRPEPSAVGGTQALGW